MPTINQTTATRLCNNYIQNVNRITDDANHVSFSIQEIENFINLAKRNGAASICVYFGKYDNTDPSPCVPGQTTVFLSAVDSNQNNLSMDAMNYGQVGIPPIKTYP